MCGCVCVWWVWERVGASCVTARRGSGAGARWWAEGNVVRSHFGPSDVSARSSLARALACCRAAMGHGKTYKNYTLLEKAIQPAIFAKGHSFIQKHKPGREAPIVANARMWRALRTLSPTLAFGEVALRRAINGAAKAHSEKWSDFEAAHFDVWVETVQQRILRQARYLSQTLVKHPKIKWLVNMFEGWEPGPGASPEGEAEAEADEDDAAELAELADGDDDDDDDAEDVVAQEPSAAASPSVPQSAPPGAASAPAPQPATPGAAADAAYLVGFDWGSKEAWRLKPGEPEDRKERMPYFGLLDVGGVVTAEWRDGTQNAIEELPMAELTVMLKARPKTEDNPNSLTLPFDDGELVIKTVDKGTCVRFFTERRGCAKSSASSSW